MSGGGIDCCFLYEWWIFSSGLVVDLLVASGVGVVLIVFVHGGSAVDYLQCFSSFSWCRGCLWMLAVLLQLLVVFIVDCRW